ncbi:MAG: threonine aldolase family protein [Fibrobacterota bacterium]
MKPDFRKNQFASDNYSGICPEAFQEMEKANSGHALPYGEDSRTKGAADKIRQVFETDCEVFFVFTGTAANSLAAASLCKPFESIVCSETAHIETDECGAPEFFTNGSKILTGKTSGGKLLPEGIIELVNKRSDIHYPRPAAISLTQPTELGTLYSLDELSELKNAAADCGLKIHMDGARFANAAAALECSPAEIVSASGVDVLCLGGAKNGMCFGEAVVFFDKKAARGFDYRCKQAGQLASKMRFISAGWLGMLESGAWLRHARHSNKCAARLADKIKNIPGVKIMFPPQANSVFLELEKEALLGLENKGWRLYSFIGTGGARVMCSWDTAKADIDDFCNDLGKICRGVYG